MGLSDADKAVCQEVFKLYEDSPGKVLIANLGEIIRAPGANPSEEEVEGFGEGKTHIELSEYLSIMERQKLHDDPVGPLQTCFGIFDADGKGTVDTMELRSVMGNLGERFSQEEIGQMMLMADIDADNKMQIEDLIKFCAKYK